MINLYNIDCMEAMKKAPDNHWDLAIVDPPYGSNDAISIPNCKSTFKQATKRKKYKVFKNIAPSPKYFNVLNRVCKKWIIWGGNYFPITGGGIVWNKNNPNPKFGDAELAICNTHSSIRIFNYTWNGMIQENMKNKEHRIHPTQKPVALYTWLLDRYAKEGDKILDTHLGSGSIAIACHDMGFHLDGFEIDEEYFQAASKRLKNHQRQLKLF